MKCKDFSEMRERMGEMQSGHRKGLPVLASLSSRNYCENQERGGARKQSKKCKVLSRVL